MKAYILYIATLLAVLALPVAAQNGGIDTKAAPVEPAMPYKLTTVTIGSNNGTVKVEDKNNSNGISFVGNDTLVYGAYNNNATAVGLTITPNTGYVIRTNYPKAYKTGDTSTTVSITDFGGIYDFNMPPYPVTLEIAYAVKADTLIPISLKKDAADIDAVLAFLPKYIPVALANGRKDSLKVADYGWELNETSYDSKAGAVNSFKVLFTLPDSIGKAKTFQDGNNSGTYWDYIKVTNKTEPLKPAEDNKGLVISGGTDDNLNSNTGSDGSEQAFNGTIEEATVKSLEIDGSVTDATLTLKDVTVSGDGNADEAKTNVQSGANLTLKVEGTSTLGTLSIENGATVVLTKSEDARLNVTEIANAGIFCDSTATITTVTGTGALDIKASVDGGGSVEQGTTIILTASTNDNDKADGITSFTWQQKNTDGSYTDIQTTNYDADGGIVTTRSAGTGITNTYTPATASVGSTSYRCLIRREVAAEGDVSSSPVITLLSTKSETVTVTQKSNPVPPTPPTPVYYTVTLPQLTGATTDPAPGAYEVESWDNFGFFLMLDKDYDQSTPIVTTSDGKTITPRSSDGKYIIKDVRSDLSVSITGIVKNAPTANEEITTPAIRVWGSQGVLHISQPAAAEVTIYTFGGVRLKSASLPAGDSQIALPAGSYVVVAGSGSSFKVIIK